MALICRTTLARTPPQSLHALVTGGETFTAAQCSGGLNTSCAGHSAVLFLLPFGTSPGTAPVGRQSPSRKHIHLSRLLPHWAYMEICMDQLTLAGRRGPENVSPPAKIAITLHVNGQEQKLSVAPWTTLLDALREHLDLTGTKKGCDHGQCGACTVLVDGRRVNSCLTLAVMKDGAKVTTIEGLADGRRAASAAAGVHRSRRIPVRLLHAGPDLLGRGPDRRGQGQDRRRNPRADERQHLPLRRLSQHRRGDPAGDGAMGGKS